MPLMKLSHGADRSLQIAIRVATVTSLYCRYLQDIADLEGAADVGLHEELPGAQRNVLEEELFVPGMHQQPSKVSRL